MKYAISLILGIAVGACLFAAAFYYNPFAARQTLSPLAVTDTGVKVFSYSAVPSEMIFFSNNGETISQPFPEKVTELWEPSIHNTEVAIARLSDSRGMPAGIGIKMSTLSESTDILRSEFLVDSVWHLYMPGRGTLAMYQQENFWGYLRDIVVPAWRNSSDSWRGSWNRDMTKGPGALGTAKVDGLGGEFSGVTTEAVETLNARAWSMQQGPVSMVGTLSVLFPAEATTGANSLEK